MGVWCVGFPTKGVICAVGCSRRCLCHFYLQKKICLFYRFMKRRRRWFCSDLLRLLRPSGGHARCHCITDPAAQRQQGNHEDEEKMAHSRL